MEPVIRGLLREEQSGFTKGRGCSDQIFVVRHLMQQANEMKASLSLCFVDFQKAFDSVSRGMMKKVLRHYGIPEWLVKLVEDLHEGTFCKVMVDGSLSDAFEVKSGVIQGGILSPLLFIMVIDYVMRKVAEETNAGIVWKDERKLVDLDYADDIVLINEGVDETQRVLDCLIRLSRWKWLGHVYRKEGEIVRRTPGWQMRGKRGRGRPSETWVRTMTREAGVECWSDLEELAQDNWWWREFIEALCIPLGATGID
ncbi:hypothetical protein Pmani_031359 [Petrolisthes manimaculis]|uniref:Reverse transcriptase domain-containing protein n=1 Tax=Petrolisthes manimaculis TaxID=1843537 RepID=A0AAE1NVU3_9EUCA|nr:hypothetical protein Pmani_031359 [Petrolisthes manimaculis]